MQSDVEKIKSRLSIVDVVSGYVDLKPAGARMKGLSPFTREKTPSFFVSPDQGYYHCFSTDQGGDIFSFIQSIEGLDFPGALKFLADRAGVELTGFKGSSGKKDEMTALYEVLEAAKNFFIARYKVASAAQHFAGKRGIHPELVDRFDIGYAPDDWRQLEEDLGKKFSTEVLLQAGLIKQKNQSTYDTFRDRLMFPIKDIAGRVVGFSGRRLDGEKTAKYLNSPETPVFKKGEVLFGLYEGRQVIKQLDFAILVEGQIDLVLVHGVGSANAVASSGTAFTSTHLQKIKRYTNNILLALDSDSAGLKAGLKVCEMAYREDMNVKTIILPAESDPADVIQSDPSSWNKLIKEAVSFPEYLTRHAKEKSRNASHFNETISKVLIPLINMIKSPIKQRYELELISGISDIPIAVIQLELNLLNNTNSSNFQFKQKNLGDKKSKSSDLNITTTPEEELLKDIAIKRRWLEHYYPKISLPIIPILADELPSINEAELLSAEFRDDRTALESLKVNVRDLIIYRKVLILKAEKKKMESEKPLSIDKLNYCNQIQRQIEDLEKIVSIDDLL